MVLENTCALGVCLHYTSLTLPRTCPALGPRSGKVAGFSCRDRTVILFMSSILVTGCLGRLGSRIVAACARSGSKVSGVDVMRGLFEAYAPGDRHPQRYLQADLADAGAAYAAIASFRPDIVVHAAAIPDMTHNTGHDVLKANTMSTYNIIEACLSLGVRKMVNISSLQILGIVKSDHEISRLPRFSYVPIDETHPIHPENPYAISKLFGEQLCDAATRRNPAFSAVSLRPTWCVDELNIERNLGSFVRDPEGTHSETVWSYVCLPDVADAVVRATEVQTTGHEVR